MMETRPFGKTGHSSSVAILGAAAFGRASQKDTDAAMELVIAAGVNHIDVAPSYGEAELRLAPWMARVRQDFFVGCKTMERTRKGAMAELRESLARLGMDKFDLYQIHDVGTQDALDAALGPGGAIEALQEARELGLTDYLGITGHGLEAPGLFIQALDRFKFDSVIFPLGFVQFQNEEYREQARRLIRICQDREVGLMAIKSIAQGGWGNQEQIYHTWYEPFDDPVLIQNGINFALSHGITGVCTAGDVRLLPLVLEACKNYQRLSDREQDALIEMGREIEPLFL